MGKQIWIWIGNVGVAKAPAGEGERIRRANEKATADVLFSLSFTFFYLLIGAWKLVALACVLSLMAPVIIGLNGLGWYQVARSLTTLSFGISIAAVNFAMGLHYQAQLLFFAGVASVFANFEFHEKFQIYATLFLLSTLTVASHWLSVGHVPLINVPAGYESTVVAFIWIISSTLLMSQISIFLKSVERSKRALLENEELYNALFEQAATGLIILSPEGFYLRVNQEFARSVGRTQEELIGLRTTAITAPEDMTRSLDDMRRLANGEIKVLKKHKSFLHKDGHSVPVYLQTCMLYHPDGRPRLIVTSAQDLTESKISEQKLIQASKMSSLGEMAGSIAHEINTPLAIIHVSAEQLEDPEIRAQLTADEITSIATTITDTVQRVAKIVKGLKAFARNAEHDAMETVTVSRLAEEAMSLCSERLKNSNIKFNFVSSEEFEVACRPTQIAQVFLNLIGNAVDAIEGQNLSERWIEMSAEKSDFGIQLRLTDSGSGIPESVAARLMEPFYTTKPLGQGTGLGLSISKGIIESHKGRLSLDRTQAHTCFVIELPAAVSALKPMQRKPAA